MRVPASLSVHMTVQSVMSGAKPHQNDLLLPGQQVVVSLCDLGIVSALMTLPFTEADIVGMLFSLSIQNPAGFSPSCLSLSVFIPSKRILLNTFLSTENYVMPLQFLYSCKFPVFRSLIRRPCFLSSEISLHSMSS